MKRMKKALSDNNNLVRYNENNLLNELDETKSSAMQILSKRESGVTTSDSSKVSEMYLYDKENIPEKQELLRSKQTQSKSKQCISSSILNQKLDSISESGGILSKLDIPKNYQTNGTCNHIEE